MYAQSLSGYTSVLTLTTQEPCDGSAQSCPLSSAIFSLKQANILPATNENGEYLVTHSGDAREHTLHVINRLADAAVSHLRPETQG